LIGSNSQDSAFHILPTILQTFPHFWIPHFTFRIPQFRILPMTAVEVLAVLSALKISPMNKILQTSDRKNMDVLLGVRKVGTLLPN